MSDPSTLSDAELQKLCAGEPDKEALPFRILFCVACGVLAVLADLKYMTYVVYASFFGVVLVYCLHKWRESAYRRRIAPYVQELERRYALPNLEEHQLTTKAEWAVSIEMTVLPIQYLRCVQLYVVDQDRCELRVVQRPVAWSKTHANKLIRKTLELQPGFAGWARGQMERIKSAEKFEPTCHVLDGTPLVFRAVQLSTKYNIRAEFNLAGLPEGDREHPIVLCISELLDLAFANEASIVMGAIEGTKAIIKRI